MWVLLTASHYSVNTELAVSSHDKHLCEDVEDGTVPISANLKLIPVGGILSVTYKHEELKHTTDTTYV